MDNFVDFEIPKVVVKGKGKGSEGVGRFVCTQNGRLKLSVVFHGSPCLAETVVITGTTEEGFCFSADCAQRINDCLQDKKYTGRYSFFEATLKRNSSVAVWDNLEVWLKNTGFRERWGATIEGYEISVSPVGTDRPGKRPPWGDIDSMMVITAKKSSRKNYKVLVRDICELLSIARRSPVRHVMIKAFKNDDFAEWTLDHWTNDDRGLVHLVPDRPQCLRAFFERVWPKHQDNKEKWGLEYSFWYYEKAFSEVDQEMQFIVGCVFMESLKYFWAKNFSGLTPIKKNSGVIREFQNNDGKRQGFRALLEMAAAHLGVQDTEFGFLEDRNCVFHTGLCLHEDREYLGPPRPLSKELERLFGHMDDFLLRILGYQGPYQSVAPPRKIQEFPTE